MSEYGRDGKHVDLEQFGAMVREASARYEEEEHIVSTSAAVVRHDEIETRDYWEYTIIDGAGDPWDDEMTTLDHTASHIEDYWKREIEYIRRRRDDESNVWYTVEDYPEPLRIVKRHVRVTAEYSNWEEA